MNENGPSWYNKEEKREPGHHAISLRQHVSSFIVDYVLCRKFI